MKIQQFEDRPLAHYSYAILSESAASVVLIDPSRDITPYVEYAAANNARITAVIETHPHADFVSGHLELAKLTGATIYCSKLLGAYYPHTSFDDGDSITLGDLKLKAINTPGHSPDSICIILEQNGRDKAVFTGDTLFIGDCGRPDLREKAGNITAAREALAKQMYYSLRVKLSVLGDEVEVYPAHGAGSLCGKALSNESSSTILQEKQHNWSLQPMTETEFVAELLTDQPFIPAYFPYDVMVNRKGAEGLSTALPQVSLSDRPMLPDPAAIVIDTRPAEVFKKGTLPGAINLQEGNSFETWLGSIVKPGEGFYLVGESTAKLRQLVARAAKIGYEPLIREAFVLHAGPAVMDSLDLEDFKLHEGDYTVLDIRNATEVAAKPIFVDAIHIPLNELRDRVNEVPAGKPVVVHCAAGYRSAAGSSIVAGFLRGRTAVYDLGEAVKAFTLPALQA